MTASMPKAQVADDESPENESAATPGREPVPPALKRFIWDIQSMVELADSEREILVIGRDLMARLVAADDWLPAAYSAPDPTGCRRYLLYVDALERFSVAATVLAGGQMRAAALEPVWEIAGVLRGAVSLTRFQMTEDGRPKQTGEAGLLSRGGVETFSSKHRDIAQFGNHLDNAVSIVIHVHGGDLSKLAHRAFTPDGEQHEAVVAYANTADAPPYDIHAIQTRITD